MVGPPRLSTNVVTTGTSGNTLRYPCNPWYHLVLHPFNRCTFSTGSTVPVAPNSIFSTVEIVVRDCAQARVNDYLLLASLPCSGHSGAVSEKWGQSRVIGGLEISGWLPSNSAHGAHGAQGGPGCPPIMPMVPMVPNAQAGRQAGSRNMRRT